MRKLSEELEEMSASGDYGVALDGLHERAAVLEIERDALRAENEALKAELSIANSTGIELLKQKNESAEHISVLRKRIDDAEAALGDLAHYAVENQRLKETMRNLPEVKVFEAIMGEKIAGVSRQLMQEHALLLKTLKSVQGMCKGAIRYRIDKVVAKCEVQNG